MAKPTTKIPISSIILDEEIYPRKGVDQKRVGIFAENIRDGFKFDPIEVEPHPDKPGKYRLLALDGSLGVFAPGSGQSQQKPPLCLPRSSGRWYRGP